MHCLASGLDDTRGRLLRSAGSAVGQLNWFPNNQEDDERNLELCNTMQSSLHQADGSYPECRAQGLFLCTNHLARSFCMGMLRIKPCEEELKPFAATCLCLEMMSTWAMNNRFHSKLIGSILESICCLRNDHDHDA